MDSQTLNNIKQRFEDKFSFEVQGRKRLEEWVDDVMPFIQEEIKKAYKKGATDFCDWNCLNADGGYVGDLREFLSSLSQPTGDTK